MRPYPRHRVSRFGRGRLHTPTTPGCGRALVRTTRWLRCEERQRRAAKPGEMPGCGRAPVTGFRGSGVAALTPQPPEGVGALTPQPPRSGVPEAVVGGLAGELLGVEEAVV